MVEVLFFFALLVLSIIAIAPVFVPLVILFFSTVKGVDRYSEWIRVKSPAHPLNSPLPFKNISIFIRLLFLQDGPDVPRKIAGCANWVRISLFFLILFIIASRYLTAHPELVENWGLMGQLVLIIWSGEQH